jgi:hypothetical protein
VSGYQPAVCNIGRRQRRRRVAYAGAGFGGAALYLLGYAGGVVPGEMLVGVFVPLMVGFEWGLQAYTSFCVRLALTGQYDFRDEAGDGPAGTVTDEGAHREDRVEAARITAVSVVLGAVATAVLVAAVP